jgi:hypothetical protein
MRSRRFSTTARVVVAAALLAACSSSDEGAGIVPASAEPRQNVMVIDQGIDLSAAELHGRVAAAFTLACATVPADPATDEDAGTAPAGGDATPDGGTPSDGAAEDPAAFQVLKARYIARLMVSDQSCQLRAGIDAKQDPLSRVARYRRRWNSMLRGNKFANQVFSEAEWDQLLPALTTEFGRFAYHGTATAGVIAHDNPEVRLVLVQRELGDRGEMERNFQCFQQKQLDSTVALLSDPEVRDAYIQAPLARGEADLQAALVKYNVGLVNLSFGQISRAALEQLQASKGCPAVDLKPYFAIVSGIERARSAATNGQTVLTIRAAGNDGAEVNSPADLIECAPGDLRNVVVGSTDLAQQRSAFSNWGLCVDLAAPGEDVITTYAGGWLVNAFGTSFSAPLVARLVSRSTPADDYQASSARAALLDRRAQDGSLAITTFPSNFFYQPRGGLTPTSGALTASTAVLIGRASAVNTPPPPPAELARLLAPLQHVRALWPRLRPTR